MINPKTYKKLVVKQLSRDFRSAVDIVEADFPIPAPNKIVVRNLFAGVNASQGERIMSIKSFYSQ